MTYPVSPSPGLIIVIEARFERSGSTGLGMGLFFRLKCFWWQQRGITTILTQNTPVLWGLYVMLRRVKGAPRGRREVWLKKAPYGEVSTDGKRLRDAGHRVEDSSTVRHVIGAWHSPD